MRIIGYIKHPHLKITVFKMDNRVSVKFENDGYEQTFKLGMDDRLASLDAVRHWADAALLDEVSRQMQQMHRMRLTAMTRAFPPDSGPEFEEII